MDLKFRVFIGALNKPPLSGHCKQNIKIREAENIVLTRSKNQHFDIIFADPPYTGISFHSIKEKIETALKPGGIFCMEMKKKPIDEPNVRVKHYGSTQVVFWGGIV